MTDCTPRKARRIFKYWGTFLVLTMCHCGHKADYARALKNLSLTVDVPDAPLMVGEWVTVKATLTNIGKSDITVPKLSYFPCFDIKFDCEDRLVGVLNGDNLVRPSHPEPNVTIKPGQQQSISEKTILNCAGNYTVRARFAVSGEDAYSGKWLYSNVRKVRILGWESVSGPTKGISIRENGTWLAEVREGTVRGTKSLFYLRRNRHGEVCRSSFLGRMAAPVTEEDIFITYLGQGKVLVIAQMDEKESALFTISFSDGAILDCTRSPFSSKELARIHNILK